jgi:hypothetical protein
MKKIIFDIIQISIFLVLVSCSKEKVCNNLPTGSYTGEFITANGNQLPNQTMQLTEVSSSYLVINGTNISRNECSVMGTFSSFPLLYQGGPVTIQGQISKKKGKYFLDGFFFTTQFPVAQPVSGTFKLKQN